MFLRNLKINVQLYIGFGIMFLFVIALSVVSYIHSDLINSQTELLYHHPLQVRRAIGKLETDIYKMRLATRNLMIYKNRDQQKEEVNAIEIAAADARKQFEIIFEKHVGNKAINTSAENAFIKWEAVRKHNTDRILNGDIDTAKELVLADGEIGLLRTDMLKKIKIVDESVKEQAESIYLNSMKLNDRLRLQLSLITFFILVFVFIIAWFIIDSIRKPIVHLTHVMGKFQEGNFNVRSKIKNKNEFGILSEAFNTMIESIRGNLELSERTNMLVGSMLANDSVHTFFREMLPKIAELTNSQMAAVYILSDDKKSFDHYESIGLSSDFIKMSFEADSYEGEFGAALSSKQIQHVKHIPIDTSFVYQTVSGKFIPREIVTIPIVVNDEIIAIISLASVRKYSNEANKLIESTYNIITARIEGVINYRKIRKFSKRMEIINNELIAQKVELDAQRIALKDQNEKLETQKSILEEASKLKTHFLSNMSHELRTPLNSVIALSGVLNRRLKSKISDDEYNYIEVIERNGKHLLSLINDILDISRIEAGKEEVEVTNFRAESLIEDLLEMIRPQADVKNIELKQKESQQSIFINSDYHKCRHILQNLIANAIKFTEKGKVEIELIKEKEKIKIKVIDTGIGISAENLVGIFDEFRQADSSTTRRYGGTGLGLAIAKKYANLLGGTIHIESAIDQGSVFTLTLPLNYSEDNRVVELEQNRGKLLKSANDLNNDATPQVLSIVNKKDKNTKERLNILVVEDNSDNMLTVKAILEEKHNIYEATDGLEALVLANKYKPDLILMDVALPGIDGIEAVKRIRLNGELSHIPIIALTASAMTSDRETILAFGFEAYISKPINEKEFFRTINRVLYGV